MHWTYNTGAWTIRMNEHLRGENNEMIRSVHPDDAVGKGTSILVTGHLPMTLGWWDAGNFPLSLVQSPSYFVSHGLMLIFSGLTPNFWRQKMLGCFFSQRSSIEASKMAIFKRAIIFQAFAFLFVSKNSEAKTRTQSSRPKKHLTSSSISKEFGMPRGQNNF